MTSLFSLVLSSSRHSCHRCHHKYDVLVFTFSFVFHSSVLMCSRFLVTLIKFVKEIVMCLGYHILCSLWMVTHLRLTWLLQDYLHHCGGVSTHGCSLEQHPNPRATRPRSVWWGWRLLQTHEESHLCCRSCLFILDNTLQCHLLSFASWGSEQRAAMVFIPRRSGSL